MGNCRGKCGATHMSRHHRYHSALPRLTNNQLNRTPFHDVKHRRLGRVVGTDCSFFVGCMYHLRGAPQVAEVPTRFQTRLCVGSSAVSTPLLQDNLHPSRCPAPTQPHWACCQKSMAEILGTTRPVAFSCGTPRAPPLQWRGSRQGTPHRRCAGALRLAHKDTPARFQKAQT